MPIRKLTIFILIFNILTTILYSKDWDEEKAKAEKLYSQAKYDESIILFREIILSSKNDNLIAESYFWLAKAYIDSNKLKLAETNLEYYLTNYKTTGLNYPEAFYEKGRLLFLQEQFQASVKQLNSFIENYPNNSLLSNAYYWIGECLYALGQYDDSGFYFNIVLTKYPNSIKEEASRYKLRLIEHKKSELTLQNLLKWSQEQYISALTQFRIKEKSLQEALDKYKAGGTAIDSQQLGNLQNENNDLKQKLKDLQDQIELLKGNGSDQSIIDRLKQLQLKEKLLSDKEDALRILEQELRPKGQ